jgi:uncharacterized protein YcbK (DUF882 family)
LRSHQRNNDAMNVRLKSISRAVVLVAGFATLSGSLANVNDVRTLRFYHTHTRQSLDVTYYRQGRYDPGALGSVRDFMADWRNGQDLDLDPELLDILWSIQEKTGHSGTWEVISAYRSPQTNEMLRSRSSGVAKNSQHILGHAIDVRLQGLALEQLRDTARSLRMGGVGYYPGSNFVHVDTGRVRYW